MPCLNFLSHLANYHVYVPDNKTYNSCVSQSQNNVGSHLKSLVFSDQNRQQSRGRTTAFDNICLSK